MSTYALDQQWFQFHPKVHQYQRPPQPDEWPNLAIPPDAVVTVHFINQQCLVRVLASPQGPRLAEAVDTDPTQDASLGRALEERLPWHRRR